MCVLNDDRIVGCPSLGFGAGSVWKLSPFRYRPFFSEGCVWTRKSIGPSLSSVGQESLASGPIAVTAGGVINSNTTASF